jgi:hypothetical protein
MDPISVTLGAVSLISAIVKLPRNAGISLIFFLSHYKSAGAFLWLFGSREVWHMQMQVLGSSHDTDAMNFKKSVQEDSSIVAVAVSKVDFTFRRPNKLNLYQGTILAQIAITALSLEDLSQIHWTARAFFIFSLVSSIIAVYYATRQYHILGRCLRAEQVKAWIMNKDPSTGANLDTPSVASVITVSAPNMLLSSSLNSFLVGLGVYLGFTWTRNLDETAGVNSSRAVFITYIVGLSVCYGVYALSSAVVANQTYVSEIDMLQRIIPKESFNIHLDDEETGRGNNQPDTSRGSNIISRTRQVSSEWQSHPKSFSNNVSTCRELLEVLQEVAELRKESAKVDEHLAKLLERLGEDTIVSP